MALIECRFFSEVLGEDTSMFVIIPTITFEEVMQRKQANYRTNAKYQTLYLLHGLSDDHSSWLRNTSIERYAQEKCLAVVMPAAGKSFYADMAHGSRYWTFISEEIPRVARSLFPLSEKREDNFAAGVSMGGYGAFKLALRKPESFAAAASLSGAADLSYMVSMAKQQPPMKKMLENIFGNLDEIIGSDNDLIHLLKKLKNENADIPKLYQCCGTEDPGNPLIVNFNAFAKDLGIDLTFEDGPGGHTWAYWDSSIQRVLEWLPLKNTTV
ncbi:MAG: alpha/beta hydrolase [Chitinophagales bacterium]